MSNNHRQGQHIKATAKALGKVIHIDDERIQDHLGMIVRGPVEETLNALPDADTDIKSAGRFLSRGINSVFRTSFSSRLLQLSDK